MVIIAGLDDAGRGPIIGPMVLAGVSIDEADLPKLEALDIKDSKLLTQKKREFLYEKIRKVVKDYKIILVQPEEIDDALKSPNLNLNWLEAIKFAQIINYLNPDKAIVDCPSPNIKSYSNYLMMLLKNKNIKLMCEHKADFNHKICGAASILAKCAREEEVKKLKKKYGEIGSGYMADKVTKKFFDENFEKHPEIFRKTWAPYSDHVNNKSQKKLEEF